MSEAWQHEATTFASGNSTIAGWLPPTSALNHLNETS
jgi:hypothetical protein